MERLVEWTGVERLHGGVDWCGEAAWWSGLVWRAGGVDWCGEAVEWTSVERLMEVTGVEMLVLVVSVSF